jgi:hypothetical protein
MAEPLLVAGVVSGTVSILTAIGHILHTIRAKRLSMCCGLCKAEMNNSTPGTTMGNTPLSPNEQARRDQQDVLMAKFEKDVDTLREYSRSSFDRHSERSEPYTHQI